MSRFLFVSLPLPGHVNPMAAVATALTARGHEVVWAGSESFLRPRIGDQAVVIHIDDTVIATGAATIGQEALDVGGHEMQHFAA